MKIIVYASLDPEQMYKKGRTAGLSEKAADYFRYFTDLKLALSVNDDGEVYECECLEKFK